MKKVSQVLLIGFLAILFSACTSAVYYKTEVLPNTIIDKSKIIKVFVAKDATIEEKKMQPILEKKLRDYGYTIDDSKPFDYVIIYKLTEDSFTTTKVETDYIPTTSYSSGYVNGQYTTIRTVTQTPDTSSRTVTNTYKKNYFKIGDVRQIAIWEGFTSVDNDTYNLLKKDDFIDGVVKLIGKDFRGYLYVEYR